MSRDPKKTKILAVASNGGHWQQMRQVAPAFGDAKVTFASTALATDDDAPFHADIRLSDYSQTEIGKVLLGLAETLGVVLKLRPHVVVSTGAAPGLLCLFWGRVLGAKTIWIDSIANSEKLSLSGRLARGFCHVVCTQWDHLKVEGKVHFWGSVV